MSLLNGKWEFDESNFGPLLPYVNDPMITDINYNGTDVWIEDLTKGVYKSEIVLDKQFVNQFCIRIANLMSKQFNKQNNVLEAETDSLRISIIHPDVTDTGVSISIRKTPAIRRLTEESMIAEGYCHPDVLRLLKNCINAKMNIVFCGTPGSGKTELLKFLTQYIPLTEKVMTIEDNLEIHYKQINPGSNCVELKVDPTLFTYTNAIKAALRQNPQWVLLSEARSVEVKYLLECFSTGLHGLTTLHTDDVRKIPDRIQNMMQDAYAASRLENDIYNFINVGILLRKKVRGDKVIRMIDQICLFDRVNDKNMCQLLVKGGRIVSREITPNIATKFEWNDIKNPFKDEGEGFLNEKKE